MAEAQLEFPTFADFGEDNMDEVGGVSSPPEAKEEEKPEVPAAAPQGPDFFERMAQIDAEREAARQAEESRKASVEFNRKRWAELHTPPPLPTGEEAEKLVIDPEALLEVVRRNQEWTRNLVGAYGSAMNQLRAETAQTIEQSQAYTTAVTIAASRVSNHVANQLRAEGIEDVDAAMEEADQALFSEPSRYVAYRTSPQHFEQAVRFVISQRQNQPHAAAPRRSVASGPALPYTPGTPTPASAATASGVTREDVAKAQRLLDHKFSPSLLKKLGMAR